METNWRGGLQLQWAAQAEFPSVLRLFEHDCWAIPLAAAWRRREGGIFAVPTAAVAGLDLSTEGDQVEVPSIGGQAKNRTSRGFLRCVVYRDSRRPRRPAGSNHRCSIWSNLVRSRQTAPAHAVSLSAAESDRCSAVEEVFVHSIPGSAEGLCCPLSSNCQTRERHVGLSVALRDCLPSVRVKPSSRLPRSCTWSGFAGRLAALEGSPIAVHFTSCFAGHDSCSADVCKPCGAGSSHSAWSRCWYRSQPSRQAALRYIVEKRGAFQVPASQSRRGPRGAGLSVGRSSAWNQGWRRWRQSRTRSSTSAGQEGECPGVWEETLRCSALCARDASALESSLQRTGKGVRKDLMTLVGESWGWQRHATEHLLRHCGHLRTPRRVIVMVAGALDEGRIDSVPRCARFMECSNPQERTADTT